MTNIIIPLIVLYIISYGFIKNINIYDEFIKGVEEGLKLVLSIFPTIFAMSVAVNILINSNIINYIITYIKIPLIPKELIPLAIMRPISGSSSFLILDNILKNIGPDTLTGKIASVMQGSTDTTIYILALYFSSVSIKKTKYALVVGLLTDMIAIVLSIIIVKYL